MSTIYEMSEELRAVMEALEESGGEITTEIQADLDGIEAELPARVDSLARLAREFAARSEARKAEARRMNDAAASDANASERIKAYLGDCLRVAGLRKVNGHLFGVSICRNSQPSVEVEEVSSLPAGFQRITIEPDKKALIEAWKSNATLPSGVTVTVGEHVRIG